MASLVSGHIGANVSLFQSAEIILLLDKEKRIVLATDVVARILNIPNTESILTKKPWEIIKDITTGKFGTDTTILSILEKLKTSNYFECECETIIGDGSEQFLIELRITAAPLYMNGHIHTAVYAQNICEDKSRRALERTFFHDILDTATAIDGAFQLLLTPEPGYTSDQLIQSASAMSTRLVDGIIHQRLLLSSECNELLIKIRRCQSLDIIRNIQKYFFQAQLLSNQEIAIDKNAQDVSFDVDIVLIERVLMNMVKNALEASNPNTSITLCCLQKDSGVEFTVHNEGEIPVNVQKNIFKRFFSTKGEGRGLGTHSIKLFTEVYMNGKACFSSDSVVGTVFRVWYPLIPKISNTDTN